VRIWSNGDAGRQAGAAVGTEGEAELALVLQRSEWRRKAVECCFGISGLLATKTGANHAATLVLDKWLHSHFFG
jgi:hypothetical protein